MATENEVEPCRAPLLGGAALYLSFATLSRAALRSGLGEARGGRGWWLAVSHVGPRRWLASFEAGRRWAGAGILA